MLSPAILDSLPCVIAVIDITKNNKIVYVNRSFSKYVTDINIAVGLTFEVDIIESGSSDIFRATLLRFLSSDGNSTDQVEVVAKTVTTRVVDRGLPIYQMFRWVITGLNSSYVTLTGEPLVSPSSSTATSGPVSVEEQSYSPDTYTLSNRADLEDFFQNAPIAMHYLSMSGRILWANKAELETLGYSYDEYVGRHISEFCPDEGKAYQGPLSRAHSGSTIKNSPFKYRSKNGCIKYRIVDIDVIRHQDGSFRHMRCFIKEDAENRVKETVAEHQRAVEQAVAAEKDKLVRRVFHEIKTPLHVASNQLDDFLSSDNAISKNQLAQIQRQLDGVSGIVEDLSFLLMFESNNVIKSQLEPTNLSSTCQDIIALTRAVEMRAGQTVDFVVEMNDVPVSVMASPCLRRVLFNLCRNAVRFSPDETIVSISVQYAPLTSQNTLEDSSEERRTRRLRSILCQSVSDNMGEFSFKIRNTTQHPVDLVLINDYFHNRNLSQEWTQQEKDLTCGKGLGLSLYVCYNMVQSMGGLLGCSGNAEHTSFSFTIPLAVGRALLDAPSMLSSQTKQQQQHRNPDRIRRVASMQAIDVEWASLEESSPAAMHVIVDEMESRSISPTPPASAKKLGANSIASRVSSTDQPLPPYVPPADTLILVVDDSSLCQKIVCSALSKNGLLSEVANNGREAVEKVEKSPNKYSLIIMDLRMPIMDGITAIRIIRGPLNIKSVPIIALTAELGATVLEEVLEAGANAAINKPVRKDEIMEAICNLLRPL